MTDFPKHIAEIIDSRRTRVVQVQKEILLWRQLDEEISKLITAISDLRLHPRTAIELKDKLASFQITEIRKEIAEAFDFLRILEARYARGTINIGVSGRARVGKSTLLRAISGLGDDQIPTGSGLPVTAVRSSIFHSRTHERAVLTRHTFDTFRDDVLSAYHKELGIPGLPHSVDDFRNWLYGNGDPSEPNSQVTLRRRIKEMQEALWSFEQDLVGDEISVNLDELRQFVSYPSNDQINRGNCARRYLGIRDVRIECRFPHAQVENVGFIDLPGLGELASDAEQYHLRGLQNEVDIILLVKRPAEGMAYWGREDGDAVNLLDGARGFIKNRRDFIFVVINSGDGDGDRAEALRDDIRRQVNDGENGKHFQVLEANASSQTSVYEGILAPVLQHLTSRLSFMDQEIFDAARVRRVLLSERIRSRLTDLEAIFADVRRSGGSTTEDVDDGAVELRKDIAESLAKLVDRLMVEARSHDERPDYIAAVETACEGIYEWVDGGFGAGGKDRWVSDALRTMRVDQSSSPFAVMQLNRMRVEISHRYQSLDEFLHDHVESLRAEVAGIFRRHLGMLLEDCAGSEALRKLNDFLEEASEPCQALSKALRDLLELRVEYRTHLHPRVRRELDSLRLQLTDNQTGKLYSQFMASIDESGAEELFRLISELAIQAAHNTKNMLVLEAMTPALIFHASVEQFEDALIRSGDSEREFKRFARSYRDEIWPGKFAGMDEANARFSKVSKLTRSVRTICETVERGQV